MSKQISLFADESIREENEALRRELCKALEIIRELVTPGWTTRLLNQKYLDGIAQFIGQAEGVGA